MKKEEIFQIKYRGRIIEIPKSNVNFENGYAVVKNAVKLTHGWKRHYQEYVAEIMGVVNEKFETVLDFQEWYIGINILPQRNIIATINTSTDGRATCKTQHYRITEKEAVKVNEIDCEKYDIINDTTIQTKNNIFMNGYEALYDVVTGQFISEKFTKIHKFEKVREDLDEKLAKAVVKIPYNDDSTNTFDVVCYIDKKGKIRTPLYNSHINNTIDTTSAEFNFIETIKSIEKEAQEDTKKNLNQLVMSIRSKKYN